MESTLPGSSTLDSTAGIGKETKDTDFPSVDDGFRLGEVCRVMMSFSASSFSTDKHILGSKDFSTGVGVEVQQESAADDWLSSLR